MLNFNRSGLLVPSSIIASNLKELQSEFITHIGTTERINHFNSYINYSNALKILCGNNGLIQWVDGSFVTKMPKPNDIDIVSFIDFQIISSLGNKLQSFKYPASETIFQVDAYIVPVYPIGHHHFYLTQHDKAYWIDMFDKTRRNRAGNRLSKGFLEIIY
ncbi:MAG: hypothetical protein ABIN67_16185 [Ferruginibacter sp.]